jgi:PilZ domain
MYLICPKCSREFVKRVSRQGKAERFLSVFYIYPFRCQLCGYRFRFMQWGIRYRRLEEDRREYERLTVNVPVSVRGENIYTEGTVRDLSLGGCTAVLDTQLSSGDLCSMGLYLANDVLPIRINAAVVRSARSNSLGIEFLRFQDNDRERLQLFIRGLLVARPMPAVSRDSTNPVSGEGESRPPTLPNPVEL